MSAATPMPLTAYGRHCRAEQNAKGAEAWRDFTALAIANALADGAAAEEIEDKLYLFKTARENFSRHKADAESAEAEYYAEIDARMAERKKMPPAVRAAEGVETPNS